MMEDEIQDRADGAEASAPAAKADQGTTSNPDSTGSEYGPNSDFTATRSDLPVSWTRFVFLATAIVMVAIFLAFAAARFLTGAPSIPDHPSVGLVSLALALAIVASVSIATSFWLYYTRAIYLKEGPALVPERWGQIIENLAKQLESSQKASSKTYLLVTKNQDIVTEKVEEALQNFMQLRDALDRRDKEIARLRKGYDSTSYRRLLIKFIKVFQQFDLIIKEKSFSDGIYILEMLEDALEECGVEKFSPSIGLDYRDAGSLVDENIRRLVSSDTSKHFGIAEVDRQGFLLKGQGHEEILLPAKVAVFLPEPDNSKESING